ncbi:MAG: aminotransferase class V-fold PLP-dependent enzyme [Bacteriovoracaceae bacterium]|nr:aminotransferase class V-fold PLP-dependent enzyme [Bacteriovoracaceae bacterium]
MIYADANGSLPLLPEVVNYLSTRIPSSLYGNPNAIHSLGSKIKSGMERSRRIASEILGSNSNQLIWTSGASEGISTVLQNILLPKNESRRIIVSSPIEHAAVMASLNYYVKVWGYELQLIPTSTDGIIDFNWLENFSKENAKQIALVTCMGVNNETGVLQPWEKIRDLTNQLGLTYFCDTTQIIGRVPFHFKESGLKWAMASGHKLGALPGSGFLLVQDPTKFTPFIWGGGQENGHRGGTQNYVGSETLAIALQTLPEKLKKIPDHLEWRKKMEAQYPKEAIVIGQKLDRLPGTSLVGIPGLHGQGIQIELESQDIFVTTSAACSDNEPATSKVLRAMQIDDVLGRSVVRVSLPLSSNENEYMTIAKAMTAAHAKLNKIKAY